jgi:hypothetical protein
MMMLEKKSQEKQVRWELLLVDEKLKDVVDERRDSAEKKHAMVELTPRRTRL